jgi:LysM repeat protein
MKKFFLFIFALQFTFYFVSAQKPDLIIKSSDKGLYLEHKVAPKESFFALGRLYNVSPKFLASYNKLEINKGLQIDQKIRIPLTDTNFVQEGVSGTPVYYKVGDKEDLGAISKKHNGVKLLNLKIWNNLSSNEVKKDTKLVVGFLKSKGMPSATLITVSKTITEPKDKTEETPVIKAEEKPVVNEMDTANKKTIIKEEIKKPEPVIKEEIKMATSGEGYFKSSFDQQVKITPAVKNETVTSGIFKTESGWQDAKYYLLMDGVSPGTIIKIINPENNKAVYAKVLGEMSGIRQNEGLNIRISNAAAAALQIKEEDKFIVKVNY